MIQLPSNDFPVTLAFPPQGHWTQPHLALPCLKAWLHASGYGDVEQMDLSVEAFDHFLTAESLTRAAEKVQRRLPLDRFKEDRLPLGQMRAWRAAAESAASAESVIERVEAAKAVMGRSGGNSGETAGGTRPKHASGRAAVTVEAAVARLVRIFAKQTRLRKGRLITSSSPRG